MHLKAKLLTADSSKSTSIKPLNRFNENSFNKNEIESFQFKSSLEEKKKINFCIFQNSFKIKLNFN
jgi:hypothetical protein